MAFIRWKTNKFGIRQAYLVHSYRDEQGRPRQRTLAYLGKDGKLRPPQLLVLKQLYQKLNINWDQIQAPERGVPDTDLASLADAELIVQMRQLRRKRGLNVKEMVARLQDIGVPTVTYLGFTEEVTLGLYQRLERQWETQNSNFSEAGLQLAPYLRKALE